MLIPAIAGKISRPYTKNPQPKYANLLWSNDFDGSVAINALADDGTHNGVTFIQSIGGADSSGYDFGSDLILPLNSADARADITYILSGHDPSLTLADVPLYAQPIIQQTDGPGGALVKSLKTRIIDRSPSVPGDCSASPQIHLQMRRGLQESVQPPELKKFYIELYFRLAPNVQTYLSSHPGSTCASNWMSVFEIKKGYQWYRLLGKYYYSFGSYRFSVQCLYSGGKLVFRAQGDYNANMTIGVQSPASFTAGISGNALTVSAISAGTILPGMTILSGATTAKIVSGDPLGGVGSYVIAGPAQSVATGTAMTAGDANVGVTYWYFDSPADVDLNKWIKLGVYIETPSSQDAVSEGRTRVTMQPDGGIETVVCDLIGQSGGRYQCGSIPSDRWGRFFPVIGYSGGDSPFGTEVTGIRWYDGYPYALV